MAFSDSIVADIASSHCCPSTVQFPDTTVLNPAHSLDTWGLVFWRNPLIINMAQGVLMVNLRDCQTKNEVGNADKFALLCGAFGINRRNSAPYDNWRADTSYLAPNGLNSFRASGRTTGQPNGQRISGVTIASCY